MRSFCPSLCPPYRALIGSDRRRCLRCRSAGWTAYCKSARKKFWRPRASGDVFLPRERTHRAPQSAARSSSNFPPLLKWPAQCVVLQGPQGKIALAFDPICRPRRNSRFSGSTPRLGRSAAAVSASALLDDGTPVVLWTPMMFAITAANYSAGARYQPYWNTAEAVTGRRAASWWLRTLVTVRELERKLLANQGYIVETAVDGADAMARPAVRHLRSPRHRHRYASYGWHRTLPSSSGPTPSARPALSSWSLTRTAKQDRARGLEAGADFYLPKSSYQDESLIHGQKVNRRSPFLMKIAIVNDSPSPKWPCGTRFPPKAQSSCGVDGNQAEKKLSQRCHDRQARYLADGYRHAQNGGRGGDSAHHEGVPVSHPYRHLFRGWKCLRSLRRPWAQARWMRYQRLHSSPIKPRPPCWRKSTALPRSAIHEPAEPAASGAPDPRHPTRQRAFSSARSAGGPAALSAILSALPAEPPPRWVAIIAAYRRKIQPGSRQMACDHLTASCRDRGRQRPTSRRQGFRCAGRMSSHLRSGWPAPSFCSACVLLPTVRSTCSLRAPVRQGPKRLMGLILTGMGRDGATGPEKPQNGRASTRSPKTKPLPRSSECRAPLRKSAPRAKFSPSRYRLPISADGVYLKNQHDHIRTSV